MLRVMKANFVLLSSVCFEASAEGKLLQNIGGERD